MRITFNDSRSLAIALVQPAVGKFFNWATTGWETQFNDKSHLRPMVPMETPPSIFSTVQTADTGDTLAERCDVAVLIIALDTVGKPVSVVDCWTVPFQPSPPPISGGFTWK